MKKLRSRSLFHRLISITMCISDHILVNISVWVLIVAREKTCFFTPPGLFAMYFSTRITITEIMPHIPELCYTLHSLGGIHLCNYLPWKKSSTNHYSSSSH